MKNLPFAIPGGRFKQVHFDIVGLLPPQQRLQILFSEAGQILPVAESHVTGKSDHPVVKRSLSPLSSQPQQKHQNGNGPGHPHIIQHQTGRRNVATLSHGRKWLFDSKSAIDPRPFLNKIYQHLGQIRPTTIVNCNNRKLFVAKVIKHSSHFARARGKYPHRKGAFLELSSDNPNLKLHQSQSTARPCEPSLNNSFLLWISPFSYSVSQRKISHGVSTIEEVNCGPPTCG